MLGNHTHKPFDPCALVGGNNPLIGRVYNQQFPAYTSANISG